MAKAGMPVEGTAEESRAARSREQGSRRGRARPDVTSEVVPQDHQGHCITFEVFFESFLSRVLRFHWVFSLTTHRMLVSEEYSPRLSGMDVAFLESGAQGPSSTFHPAVPHGMGP